MPTNPETNSIPHNPNLQIITPELVPDPEKLKEMSLPDQIVLKYVLSRLKNLDENTISVINKIIEIHLLKSQLSNINNVLNRNESKHKSEIYYFDFDDQNTLTTTDLYDKFKRESKVKILNEKIEQLSKTLPRESKKENQFVDAEKYRQSYIENVIELSTPTDIKPELAIDEKLSKIFEEVLNEIITPDMLDIDLELFDKHTRFLQLVLNLNAISKFADDNFNNTQVDKDGKNTIDLIFNDFKNFNLSLLLSDEKINQMEQSLKPILDYCTSSEYWYDPLKTPRITKWHNSVTSKLEEVKENEQDYNLTELIEAGNSKIALKLFQDDEVSKTLNLLHNSGVKAMFIPNRTEDPVKFDSEPNKSHLKSTISEAVISNLKKLRDTEINYIEGSNTNERLLNNLQLEKDKLLQEFTILTRTSEFTLTTTENKPKWSNKLEVKDMSKIDNGSTSLKLSFDGFEDIDKLLINQVDTLINSYDEALTPKGIFRKIDESSAEKYLNQIIAKLIILNKRVEARIANIRAGFSVNALETEYLKKLHNIASFRARNQSIGSTIPLIDSIIEIQKKGSDFVYKTINPTRINQDFANDLKYLDLFGTDTDLSEIYNKINGKLANCNTMIDEISEKISNLESKINQIDSQILYWEII